MGTTTKTITITKMVRLLMEEITTASSSTSVVTSASTTKMMDTPKITMARKKIRVATKEEDVVEAEVIAKEIRTTRIPLEIISKTMTVTPTLEKMVKEEARIADVVVEEVRIEAMAVIAWVEKMAKSSTLLSKVVAEVAVKNNATTVETLNLMKSTSKTKDVVAVVAMMIARLATRTLEEELLSKIRQQLPMIHV